MTRAEVRRPLEDMIGEIVEGLSTLQAFNRKTGQPTGVRLTDIELALPVEARVLDGPAGLVVHADMPSLRTRTDFDLPLQRVVLHLTAAPTGAER